MLEALEGGSARDDPARRPGKEGEVKIVATVYDGGMAANVGGAVESKSVIIEIPNDKIPSLIKRYFDHLAWARAEKNRYTYETLSFSLLEEETINNERGGAR